MSTRTTSGCDARTREHEDARGSAPVRRRAGFDPARLCLGLCVLAIAAAFVARSAGHLDLQLRYLAVATPAALAVTAGVAIVSHVVRRRRDR